MGSNTFVSMDLSVSCVKNLGGMMDQKEIQARIDRAKENQRKLDACKFHEFEDPATPEEVWTKKEFFCKNCGG